MNDPAPDSVACRTSTVAEDIVAGQAWGLPMQENYPISSKMWALRLTAELPIEARARRMETSTLDSARRPGYKIILYA
jgi:hypothetical protein